MQRGLDYTSKVMKDFFKANDIVLYHVYSHLKSAVAERFIKTIFTKLERYQTEKDTKRIIDVLPDIVNAYNNTYHRSIGRTPNSVTKETEQETWEYLYKDLLDKKPSKKSKVKFKVGDQVRVSKEKLHFEKGTYIFKYEYV